MCDTWSGKAAWETSVVKRVWIAHGHAAASVSREQVGAIF